MQPCRFRAENARDNVDPATERGLESFMKQR